MFGSPSVTLFMTFSNWQVNANQLEFNNFLKSGLFSPEETDLRAISFFRKCRTSGVTSVVSYPIRYPIHSTLPNCHSSVFPIRRSHPQSSNPRCAVASSSTQSSSMYDMPLRPGTLRFGPAL